MEHLIYGLYKLYMFIYMEYMVYISANGVYISYIYIKFLEHMVYVKCYVYICLHMFGIIWNIWFIYVYISVPNDWKQHVMFKC